MPTYTEQRFEEHIEHHLNQSGYWSLQPTDYDKSLCLIPDEVLQFIQDTQPKEYLKLKRQSDRYRHEPRASTSLQPEPILLHSTTALLKKEREIAGYDARIIAQMEQRRMQDHISYFGFNGTPKNKTLELFGRKDAKGTFIPYYLQQNRRLG